MRTYSEWWAWRMSSRYSISHLVCVHAVFWKWWLLCLYMFVYRVCQQVMVVLYAFVYVVCMLYAFVYVVCCRWWLPLSVWQRRSWTHRWLTSCRRQRSCTPSITHMSFNCSALYSARTVLCWYGSLREIYSFRNDFHWLAFQETTSVTASANILASGAL